MPYDISDLKKEIEKLSKSEKDIVIMEVCGTHTANIRMFGIPSILPHNIRLVSGPGCPVCVTSQQDIAAAVSIADRDGVILACFGDMMRVPCENGSLYSLYEKGRDVRLITSPMKVLNIARDNPDKQVVYFGIGFETTAPHTAALIEAAYNQGINNLSVLNAHKTMPKAISQLLKSKKNNISALLCPGHVASVIGSDAFSFVSNELHLPAAVAGFEAYDIIAAIFCTTVMIKKKETKCINMYPRAVTKSGNIIAQKFIYKVMEPKDALWRGLGMIPGSGLKIREKYASYDAFNRFEIEKIESSEPKGCLCADILRGERIPPECIHFGRSCTPENPVGPCMVSSEGCCSAYYHFRGA
jgi:hydrogenase expression/formation protein HypD